VCSASSSWPRAAPSPPAIGLELAQRDDALALEIVQAVAEPVAAPTPVDERLTALPDTGQIVRSPEGCRLATRPWSGGGRRTDRPRLCSSQFRFPFSPTECGKRNGN